MNVQDLDSERIPRHIAIILDGNGRWAKQHGKTRQQGHLVGADNVETISDALIEMGVKYFTVYAFSTENWKRAEDEVSYLMGLLKRYLIQNRKDAIRRKIRIRVLGDVSRLSPDLRKLIQSIEEDTKDFTNFNLQFAINYGGRDEILRAVRRIAADAVEGRLSGEELTEDLVASYLDTRGIPDPDLLIRTSGELRLSNFLLWQIAYAELYFTKKYWPDFSTSDLETAILDYASRERRYGGRKSK